MSTYQFTPLTSPYSDYNSIVKRKRKAEQHYEAFQGGLDNLLTKKEQKSKATMT